MNADTSIWSGIAALLMSMMKIGSALHE